MGQVLPGTPGAEPVPDGVEDLPHRGGAGPAAPGWRGQQRLEDRPLGIGQVGLVEASGLGRGGAGRPRRLAGAGSHRRGLSPGPRESSVVVGPYETEKASPYPAYSDFQMPSQEQYEQIVDDPTQFRAYLDRQIEATPDLFPPEIRRGYRMKDTYTSGRTGGE